LNKIFNITNGDCLAEQLKETTISGEMIICREALVQVLYRLKIWMFSGK
jgi:hypothetical protein